MIKRIKWFFIQFFALDYRYEDIPDWEESLDREKAVFRAERILKGIKK